MRLRRAMAILWREWRETLGWLAGFALRLSLWAAGASLSHWWLMRSEKPGDLFHALRNDTAWETGLCFGCGVFFLSFPIQDLARQIGRAWREAKE